jgi:hypothetical protein
VRLFSLQDSDGSVTWRTVKVYRRMVAQGSVECLYVARASDMMSAVIVQPKVRGCGTCLRPIRTENPQERTVCGTGKDSIMGTAQAFFQRNPKQDQVYDVIVVVGGLAAI